MVGVTILMKVLDVKRAVIGIENNKKDAIAHLSNLAKNYPGIEVEALKVQYPQGGEKQLIDAIIGRQVPSGRIPIEVEQWFKMWELPLPCMKLCRKTNPYV